MTACADLRVLFRIPAGPRRGYGHLVRCRSLARALGVRPLLSIRGPRHTLDVALRLGCDVVCGTARRLIRSLEPDLVVVDDPIAAAAAEWIAEARAHGAAVVTIHDLGLGCRDGDLLIDGSVVPVSFARGKLRGARVSAVGSPARRQSRPTQGRTVAVGPAFAIIDPAIRQTARRGQRHARQQARVVVSLGGGPRTEVACAIANEIARRASHVEVRVIGGFRAVEPPARLRQRLMPNVHWVGASTQLAEELMRARVAVVGGGVSLYEACAVGTAAVAVPVVPSQRPTVGAFVSRGAALGRASSRIVVSRVAEDALALLERSALRKAIAQRGHSLVDGRGAVRAARAIAQLVEGRS